MSRLDTQLAIGTGFMYEHNGELFLVTNGHNVTRMNPESCKRITTNTEFPIAISTMAKVQVKDEPSKIGIREFEIPLYDDKEFKKPNWYVHPKFGYLVDVIAIRVSHTNRIPEHVVIHPINSYEWDQQYRPEIGDDVFILGYPFNLQGVAETPIWKRGTIATEPTFDVNKLPQFYVDTASRSGMSGSPVIMRRTGIHGLDMENPSENALFGRIQNFLGVYSGRIGADDEFKAQLGIVWKSKVIEEIIYSRKFGSTEFQNK